MLKSGCNVLIHGVDISLFTTKLKQDLAFIKQAAGDGQLDAGAEVEGV